MLADALAQEKSTILERWRDALLANYSEQGASFVRTKKDRFANPVGHTVEEALSCLFDHFRGAPCTETTTSTLTRLIRLRAVQESTASQTLSFLFRFKDIVRHCLGKTLTTPEAQAALHELDGRVDAMALVAFDVYVASREKLSEIKVEEARRMTAKTMERLQRAETRKVTK